LYSKYTRALIFKNDLPVERGGSGGDANALAAQTALNQVEGHILVQVMEGAELDWLGAAESKLQARVVVRCGGNQQTTSKKNKTASPVWSQTFSFAIASLGTDSLELEVLSGTTTLGTWTFGLQELVKDFQGSMRGWVPLSPPPSADSKAQVSPLLAAQALTKP
jgi:hypothetical protein